MARKLKPCLKKNNPPWATAPRVNAGSIFPGLPARQGTNGTGMPVACLSPLFARVNPGWSVRAGSPVDRQPRLCSRHDLPETTPGCGTPSR